jgi:TolA-binding protein
MLIGSSGVALAADKTLVEVQRDVAQLQDMVKQLQRSQDEKFGALQVLVQQALGSSNDANKSVAVIQAGLQQSLRDIETKVTTPVASLSTRMDQMSSDMRTLQGAVSDLTAVLARVQTQLTDLNNAVKVMQSPTAAPPSPGGAPGGGSAEASPAMSATDLFASAERDRSANRLDFALDEYAQFLKLYGKTSQAPAAQFYIGYIHYTQKDFEQAAKDFDMVLERYPSDNTRAPQAFLFKGRSLLQIPGHRNDAVSEFLQLIKQYPNNDYSKDACKELQSLGRNCGPPRAAAPAKGAKKKR